MAAGYVWRDRGEVISAWASVFVLGGGVIISFTELMRGTGGHPATEPLALLRRALAQRYGEDSIQVIGGGEVVVRTDGVAGVSATKPDGS